MVSTRIFSEPSGADFTVDGQVYRDSATFLWPEGSRHVLSLPAVEDSARSPFIRYYFREWQNSAGVKMAEGSTIAITADASTPYYKGIWRLFYSVGLRLPDTGPPFDCVQGPDWGKIYMSLPDADTCYAASATVWGEAGKTVNVQVHPPAGWVFKGWIGSMEGLSGPNFAFTLNGPVSMYAQFEPAARVTLATVPPGYKVYVDGDVILTPATFDWARDSVHRVGVVEPQRDETGNVLMFGSWSDGGALHHEYTVTSLQPVNLTAQLTTGYTVTVGSDPPGLRLLVDGVSTSDRRFTWALGSTHSISAPAEVTDAQGRRYVFQSWSNGGGTTQDVKVEAADQAWIAAYEGLNSLTVRSTPAGAPLVVDGASCLSSCTVHRAAGTEVQIAAPAQATTGENARIEFESWSDGGDPTHTVRLDQEKQTLTATYRAFYRFTAHVDPPEGADFRFEPASADGYYASGASVAVIVQPRTGFKFRRWEGDLTGTLPSGTVKMNGSRFVRALLDREAYVALLGVRNAVGETPETGVAPGSIIAIYGGGMTDETKAGPSSPLAQALADITVKVGDRLLPLFFVSPGQINALLPSDVAEGTHTLTVRRVGHPDLETEFQAVRNAPGLFTWPVDGVPYAMALHANGSLVTIEAPAQPGEEITLYGTGFGPHEGPALDGFAIPDGLVLPFVDPVKVLVTGREEAIDPVYTGAAAGQVGVAAIRFIAPDPAAADAPLTLRASVNGKESNAVALPVRETVP